jgi:hypothetical protein
MSGRVSDPLRGDQASAVRIDGSDVSIEATRNGNFGSARCKLVRGELDTVK